MSFLLVTLGIRQTQVECSKLPTAYKMENITPGWKRPYKVEKPDTHIITHWDGRIVYISISRIFDWYIKWYSLYTWIRGARTEVVARAAKNSDASSNQNTGTGTKIKNCEYSDIRVARLQTRQVWMQELRIKLAYRWFCG